MVCVILGICFVVVGIWCFVNKIEIIGVKNKLLDLIIFALNFMYKRQT